jgi:hypothetical protein
MIKFKKYLSFTGIKYADKKWAEALKKNQIINSKLSKVVKFQQELYIKPFKNICFISQPFFSFYVALIFVQNMTEWIINLSKASLSKM